MGIRSRRLLLALLLVLLVGTAARAQSLGEVAREVRKNREPSTRKVLTNEDLGKSLPEIRLLREPRQHPPSLGPYFPSPIEVVREMLMRADVQPNELVIDVGSGDGRILFLAAEEFGARALGIELDAGLVESSRRAAAARGLEERVQIVHANALDVDLSPAEVVTLYLSADGMELLRFHLERTLKPGTRVVCHGFPVPGWTPVWSRETDPRLYLYRIL